MGKERLPIFLRLLEDSLSTHVSLEQEEISEAVNHFGEILSSKLISEEDALVVLVYLNIQGVCKFCLTFNALVDEFLSCGNIEDFGTLILGGKDLFIEFYDNDELDIEELEIISTMLTKEIYTMALSIEQEEIIELPKYYEAVCFEEDNITKCMSKYEAISENVFTVDKEHNCEPAIYCFDSMVIISNFAAENYVNPETGRDMSDYTVSLLSRKFSKEIKMYKKYLISIEHFE